MSGSSRRVIPLTLALVGFGVGPGNSVDVPEFASNTRAVTSGSPIFSFNGKDLAGFYPFTRHHQHDDVNGVFTISDNMIRVSGQDFGGLATRESFSNYHLIVEWKWGTKTWRPRRYRARNSGIMVHCVGPDGDALATWMQSIEYQLIEGGSGDLIVAPGKGQALRLTSEVRTGPDGQSYYQKGGVPKTIERFRFNWWGRDPGWKDVLGFRGSQDVEKPVGEWNRTEVICEGDTIRCLLNGLLVNEATKSSQSSGKILLQSEGAEIFFRRFEVRPLMK